MPDFIQDHFDEDYFQDVVNLAMYTIEVIANTQYEDDEGNIDWNVTYEHVYKTYDGPIDWQMFDEAVELIEESAAKFTNELTVPPGTTIH